MNKISYHNNLYLFSGYKIKLIVNLRLPNAIERQNFAKNDNNLKFKFLILKAVTWNMYVQLITKSVKLLFTFKIMQQLIKYLNLS